MKPYRLLLFLFSAISIQAQVFDKTAINIAYRYTGRNVFQAGIEFKINDTEAQSFITGASVLYASINNRSKFLPEANIYYADITGQLYGVSINPYSVEPRIGLSLFNLIYLNTGYAIPIHKDKHFKGITFGIQLNIAPVKVTKFYDHLKVM